MKLDFLKKRYTPMRHIHTIITAVLVLTAAGCAVGPDFKQPDTKTPAAWSGLDVFGHAAGKHGCSRAGSPCRLVVHIQ